MLTILNDIKYGVRLLLKSPGSAGIAVLVIALGIGANSAIFSVVNAVLLLPLPYNHPERIVRLSQLETKRGTVDASFSFPDFVDYRSQNNVLAALAAYNDTTAALTGDNTPERITGLETSPDLFKVLETNPLLGRVLMADDKRPDPTVVVLGYRLWQRRYAGDQKVLGRQITLNGKQKTIVGVLPANFSFPFANVPLDFFVPLDPKGSMEVQRGAEFYTVIGRLKPEVTLSQAERDLRTISARLAQQYPEINSESQALVKSAHDDLVGDLRPTLYVLLAAVGLVLLICCANVANLQLARASVRGREMAVRAALGARRSRIIRQLLTESLVLSLLGGALGIALARWTIELLLRFAPTDLPRLSEINIDARVLWFTLGAAVITGVFFGLAPALQASKLNLNRALKEGGRGSSPGGSKHRTRALLIVSEVALSLILLVSAGLLMKSFIRLRNTRPGFDASQVLTASVSLPGARYPKDEQLSRFYQDLMQRLRQIPGVESAGAILPLPYSENSISVTFTVVGQPQPSPGTEPVGGARIITPDYPRAMGIPLISGRLFNDGDTAESAKVLLINQTLAKRFFPGEDPIGKRLQLGLNNINGEIVGVVGDVRDRHLDQEPRPEYYVPFQQVPVNTMAIVIRGQGTDPATFTASLRRVVQEADRELPVYRVNAMTNLVSNSIARQRFTMMLLAAFAAIALLLAAAGIFSVMSFLVSQRTHEMGLRMALGAQRRDVVRLIVGQGARLTMVGVLIGLGGAFALTRLLRGLLFGVSTTDPMTFGSIAVLFIVVGLAACYLPAWRATKVDPLIALRDL